MSSVPPVDIVIAVHNGMPYLPAAIESVLSQTWSGFVLQIVDDGSTDETPQYCRSLVDQRINYHRLNKVGFSEALNFGLRECTSRLVARMDADDVAEPNRLAAQLEFMQQQQRCTMVGCQAVDIDGEDRIIAERRFPVHDRAIRWQMPFGCPFLHPGVLFKRDDALNCGGYRSQEWPAEDYGLWTRMAARGQLANLPQTLMRYRVHPTNMTSSNRHAMIEMCGQLAGRFAATASSANGEAAARNLYLFLSGELNDDTMLDESVAAFQHWANDFEADRFQADSDLDAWMSHTERRLRWHCLERAQDCISRPWTAYRWLQRAGQFDSRQGSIAKMASRWARGRLPKSMRAVRSTVPTIVAK